jgi:alkylation response protein AidB-like acyl-CoA dehydrogenase
MADAAYLDWPFFDDRHRALARELEAWASQHVPHDHGPDVDAECRALVKALGAGGWLRHAVGGQASGGAADVIDTRAICILRETLARHSGLADFAFAMQGLGSGAISLAGSDAQKAAYLPRVARGEAIAAFALSEPEAGSDVAAMACAARADGDHYVLDGEKTWISNGGIADFYVVFARTGEAPGARGISAFIVDAGTPGFEIAGRIDVIAPHPLARLRFTHCRIPRQPPHRRRRRGLQGWRCARWTSFAPRWLPRRWALRAARSPKACSAPRRARCSAACWPTSSSRRPSWRRWPPTIDAAALLTYRAAWQRDQGGRRSRARRRWPRWWPPKHAQRVIDARGAAVHGGLGVVSGSRWSGCTARDTRAPPRCSS